MSDTLKHFHLGLLLLGLGIFQLSTSFLILVRTGTITLLGWRFLVLGWFAAVMFCYLKKVITSLATHFNPVVRGSVAVTLGFFMCGTGDLEASNTLEALLYDVDCLVVQQASLGIGFLLMQCNSFFK